MQIKKLGTKIVYNYNDYEKINAWIAKFNGDKVKNIGYISVNGNSFSDFNLCYINSFIGKGNPGTFKPIDANNLFAVCVYFAVKLVVPADWLNDRDQFLYPNALWERDNLFWSDCLAYSLFHGSNNIQSGFGVNHWLPFTEEEVGASGLFKSSFMVDFIAGKLTIEDKKEDVFNPSHNFAKSKIAEGSPRLLEFSEQATDLFTCGRKLWRYYHQEARNDENYLNDASFYDIRRYFQSVNDKGQMKQKSSDAEYNELISELRKVLKKLGDEQIVEKVFEYGFLLR